MGSILEQLAGPTDAQQNQRPSSFWGNLTGPTDGSNGAPRIAEEVAARRRGPNWLQGLIGPTDDESEAESSPAVDAHGENKGLGIGFGVIDALGAGATVVFDAVKTYRIARNKKNTPPPPTPRSTSAENVNRAVVPYDEWKKTQLQAIADIGEWPRSSFYDHPDLQVLRSKIVQFPRHRQLEVAVAEMRRFEVSESLNRDRTEKTAAKQTTCKVLRATPLSTASWNGYERWLEHLDELKHRQEDTSGGMWRYVGRRFLESGGRYVRRVIDNALATKGPEVKYTGGRVTIQMPDSHLDDQLVFDGSQLVVINPTGAQDVRNYKVSDIDKAVEISVEGAGLLQGISAIRSTTGGKAEPMLLFRRGSLVVKARGRDEELARVPMVDPVGFRRALLDAIALCTPDKPLTEVTLRVKPATVRDLLQYPWDDSAWLSRNYERNGRDRGPIRDDGHSNSSEEPGGNFRTQPGDDVSEELDKLRREIAELRRRMNQPGLPPGKSDQGEEVVDGEWTEA